MALHVALLNTMLDAAAERATTASLHTADPGSDGSSEVSGGSYARQTVTWSAASGGTLTNASSVEFDVPGGVTVTHVGLWDSAGTTFYGGIELSTPETYGAAGIYELTTLSLTLINA